MDNRTNNIVNNINSFSKINILSDAHISVKFRPTRCKTGINDRYMYHPEYEEFTKQFKLTNQGVSPLFIGQRLFHGRKGLLVVEHETGPEILVALADVGNLLSPYLDLVEAGALIVAMAEWLRRKIKANCAAKSVDRYYHDVRYLRVECRHISADGSLREKVISVLAIENSVDEMALAEVLKKEISCAYP